MKAIHVIFCAAGALALSTPVFAADDHAGHDHQGAEHGAVHDHDLKPMYGGVVSEAKEIQYELVAKPNLLTLYITDHGKPVDTRNATASITLMSASGKADVVLQAAGGNKFEAKGSYPVEAGAKALAKVSLGGKPAQVVRFTLK